MGRRLVYYLFEGGHAPDAPLARFTGEAEARDAARALETLGWRAELLARDEDPRRPRPGLWLVPYCSSCSMGLPSGCTFQGTARTLPAPATPVPDRRGL